ncbi:MAG: molecular chaperone [Desulfuromonas sp.]|nr:MAG: molecular chaperone [Desulfuromonas sp.]
MRRLAFALIALVVLACGCGYHLPGRGTALPEDIQRVYVEPFENKTTEPFLETPLTNEVRDQFSRRRTLEIVATPAEADAIMSGTIVSYRSGSVSYDRNDDITEYRATMVVNAALTRTNGEEVIWQGQVSWKEEFFANDDRAQQDYNESLAQEDLHRRLAQELYNRLTDNF